MRAGLGLLLRLQVKGWLRYLGRGLGTLRGALTALVGLMVFVPWLVAVLMTPSRGGGLEPAMLTRYGPAMLLLYCVANVIFSSSDRAIYFTPAEVQFLFSGPFSRRAVLAYKLGLTLLVSLPATLFLLLVIRVQGAWLPALVPGVLLVSTFMQLFTIVLGLLGSALGTQLFTRGRWLFGLVALGLVAALLYQGAAAAGTWDVRQLGAALVETEAWQIVTLPVRSFFDLMTARSAGELLVPLLAALAINLATVAVIFGLDSHYLESSAAASSRLYARIQRLRGKTASVEAGPPQPTARARFGLPMPPHWGGIGPIFWRQMTTASRSLGRLLLVLFILGAAGSVPLVTMALEEGRDEVRSAQVILPMLGGIAAWVTIFLTALVPYDFRGDIDRIATLKSLPIPAWRIAVGQLLTPVVLLSIVQWIAVGVAAALAPTQGRWVALAALYVLPFNFVLIGLENLLFLLFPVRLMANTPGDFQAVGRNVLLSLGKLFGLGLVATAAAVVGVIVGLVTRDVWLGVLAGWPVVIVAGMVLVPLIALAFKAFDVGRDTPA